jgi:hypothetical protein
VRFTGVKLKRCTYKMNYQQMMKVTSVSCGTLGSFCIVPWPPKFQGPLYSLKKSSLQVLSHVRWIRSAFDKNRDTCLVVRLCRVLSLGNVAFFD